MMSKIAVATKIQAGEAEKRTERNSDLSLDEIASSLGVRLGTVKSSLNRALARMKTVMSEAQA